jgi:hypothetical protein
LGNPLFELAGVVVLGGERLKQSDVAEGLVNAIVVGRAGRLLGCGGSTPGPLVRQGRLRRCPSMSEITIGVDGVEHTYATEEILVCNHCDNGWMGAPKPVPSVEPKKPPSRQSKSRQTEMALGWDR